GDLIMAAEFATEETMAFFVRHTSGVVCVGMDGNRLDELGLPLMVSEAGNGDAMGTAFTITVDARTGTTTGISAADRAATVRALADPTSTEADFARPGHLFPLRARPGGVLKRPGHTEASVDLARLAGLEPAGVLAEVVRHDGKMARLPDLRAFCAEHCLLLLSIADLVRMRMRDERLVRSVSAARLPTDWGEFTAHAFESVLDGEQHLAFVCGDLSGDEPVLVRVHSECLTGDVFASRRCDCGDQLGASMRRIAEEGRGVVVYLRGHEGRGIGIGHKLRAYELQDLGADTVDANLALGLPVDTREYGIGAQILAALGVTKMRLITNNPAKYAGLTGFGLDIVERVQIASAVTEDNVRYLRTKRERMGHLLDEVELPAAST
ncbi:bifunctional 3,4-dihydroxy-2-butanone-4-phosphate synthase/GTP cyclohydrolase II, partial [Actinokineospora sp.]|uniref:bifunctional 3,4-dihydroxy-2-butanone-4-phosphate synthase/GTP cyclohydrolase II n=1 Tax=Actinokineospora sp. TaxID=1872133 RepID=UPI003D6B7470